MSSRGIDVSKQARRRRKRNAFTNVRQKKKHAEPDAASEDAPNIVTLAELKEPSQLPITVGTLDEIAPELWSTDYKTMLELEGLTLAAINGLTEGARDMKARAPVSTYKSRMLRRDMVKAAEREDAQVLTFASMSLRQANQQRHTFSIAANSIVALSRRVPLKEWGRQRQLRQLLARSTSVRLLYKVTAARPRPDWLPTVAVQHFVFDQKYAKKGKARGEHRAAERVDSSGDLVDLVSMVYVNTIKTPLPFMLAGGLTPNEIALLDAQGPYTRPPLRVKLCLEPETVKASLVTFFKESMGFVKQALC